MTEPVTLIRTIEHEARSPKYSHIERERRWLVDSARLPPLPARHVLIEDRYLCDTRFRLRRMTDSETGETALKLAKKYHATDPAARPMVNAYLDTAEFVTFAALPADAIRKRRYVVDGYSLDRFEGALAGLLLAEREAADAVALAALAGPAWAGRDVTHDPRFQGGALAVADPRALRAYVAELAAA